MSLLLDDEGEAIASLQSALKTLKAERKLIRERLARYRKDPKGAAKAEAELLSKLEQLEDENSSVQVEIELILRQRSTTSRDFHSMQAVAHAMDDEQLAIAADPGSKKARLQKEFEALKGEKSLLIASVRNHKSTLNDVLLPRARKKVTRQIRNFKSETKLQIQDFEAAYNDVVPKCESVAAAFLKLKDGYERLVNEDKEHAAEEHRRKTAAAKTAAERDEASAAADQLAEEVEEAKILHAAAAAKLEAVAAEAQESAAEKESMIEAVCDALAIDKDSLAMDVEDLTASLQSEQARHAELLQQMEAAAGTDQAASVRASEEALEAVAAQRQSLESRLTEARSETEAANTRAGKTAQSEIVLQAELSASQEATEVARSDAASHQFRVDLLHERSAGFNAMIKICEQVEKEIATARESRVKAKAALEARFDQDVAEKAKEVLNTDTAAPAPDTNGIELLRKQHDDLMASLDESKASMAAEFKEHEAAQVRRVEELEAQVRTIAHESIPSLRTQLRETSEQNQLLIEAEQEKINDVVTAMEMNEPIHVELQDSLSYFTSSIEQQAASQAESIAEHQQDIKAARVSHEQLLKDHSEIAKEAEDARQSIEQMESERVPACQQLIDQYTAELGEREQQQHAELERLTAELRKEHDKRHAEESKAAAESGNEIFVEMSALRDAARAKQESLQVEFDQVGLSCCRCAPECACHCFFARAATS